jgi:dTDP-4-dehydrorhamnose reductase
MKNNHKNIIIFGKNGQLANGLKNIFAEKNHSINNIKNFKTTFFSSAEVDFNNIPALEEFLSKITELPQVIINATAFTAVDLAESEKEKCNNINHIAVDTLAKYCQKHNILLIHYSTDYVFDGSGEEPFNEDNIKNLKPLNYYGQTKLLGEQAIAKSNCLNLVFRVSWLYDNRATSKNFVNTIKKMATTHQIIKIVADQIGSPTNVDFISENTLKILSNLETKKLLPYQETVQRNSLINNVFPNSFPSGIYHLNNRKFCSWFDFACEIVANLKNDNSFSNEKIIVEKILPIKSSEYNFIATRPLNSRLNCRKIDLLLN